MTTRLTYEQHQKAIHGIAEYRTEKATTGDIEAFYYESMVDALDDLDPHSLLDALAEAGINPEDL